MSSSSKIEKFHIKGYEAILFDGRVEISVPDESIATDVMMKLSNAVLDKKIKSLRINLPNKILFISAHDNNHILIKATEANNKKAMN